MMPTPTTGSPKDLRQLLDGSERVFPMHPQVSRYFAAASIDEARRRLSRSIERGDGPGFVVGAPGTGKSLLLQVLAAQFQERFDVVLLACTRICTRRALLQAILFELGLPYRMRDEGELRLSLLDHLLSADSCPTGLLVLVDEAQALTAALLDELRVMTNLVRGGAPRVRLVLAGSPVLEEAFAHPELESFSQRLAARCYLTPLSREETAQFIRAQIAASGGAPDALFDSDAYAAVFDATDGVPRLVNQLCDRAFVWADAHHRTNIDRDLVQAAWADLQQLPNPWGEVQLPAAAPLRSATVEFGGLSAEPGGPIEPLSHVVFEEMLEQDSPDDIEATELDELDQHEELAPVVDVGISEPTAAVPETPPESRAPAADPFAEEFDEEEVVLDCFAAWENMFRCDAPRVANRRDPGFADLVHAALVSSPGKATETCPAQPTVAAVPDEAASVDASEWMPTVSPATFAFCDCTPDDTSADEPAETERSETRLTDWSGLRLAVVSDPMPLRPIPLVAAGAQSKFMSFESTPKKQRDTDDWPELTLRSTLGVSFLEQLCQPEDNVDATGEPILVIEEDESALPNAEIPQVRHEEYRRLFSRLSSG